MFDFTGFGENVLTFKTENENIKGQPVKVVADSTVDAAADGEQFCGIALGERCGAATVLMGGYVEMPFSGEIAHGSNRVAADGNGGVKVSENGTAVTVIKIDTENAVVGFIF
ncbi:MAG: hypothetical protein IKL44_03310 [Clostridia bacterium]|nr:hypothetical protein [Clostridia bacterium]